MEVKDILALASAGFSRSEIAAIVGALSAPAPAPAPTSAAPAPAPAPTSAAPAPAPTPTSAAPDPLGQVLAELGQLKTAVQAGNIAGSAQPAAESVDDILGYIINPPGKEE